MPENGKPPGKNEAMPVRKATKAAGIPAKSILLVAKIAVSVSGSVSAEEESKEETATAADSRADSDLAEIVQHYEKTLGMFPRSALDKLKKWKEVYSTELICKAFDEAAENNVRKWRYVEGILKGWQADGVRTLGDIEARRDARKKPEQALKCERKLAT